MIKLPLFFDSIRSGNTIVRAKEKALDYEYTINGNMEISVAVTRSQKASDLRNEKSKLREFTHEGKTYIYTLIIEDDNDVKVVDNENGPFINGFKVVQLTNGEYAYKREIDGVVLPYRYHLASNFNEYGFAMVAKDGNVSWINKEFKYLSNGEFVEEIHTIENPRFLAYKNVGSFTKGLIPLSNVGNSFIDTTGKVKKFRNISNYLNDNYTNKVFDIHITFNEKGIFIDNINKMIIYASGYYVTFEDLINIATNEGWFNSIDKLIEKCDEELKKIKKID